jgi:hypothetical protein
MTSRSKFGKAYSMADIKASELAYTQELGAMRARQGNRFCADCGRKRSAWASVTCKVFLCIDCAQVHRAMGTHVSRVKNCLGTYLWHPDEMEEMRAGGNDWAAEAYGCGPLLDRDARRYSQQEALPILLKKYSSCPKKKTLSAKPIRRERARSAKCHEKPTSQSEAKTKIKKKAHRSTIEKKRPARKRQNQLLPSEKEKILAETAPSNVASVATEVDFFETILSGPAPGGNQGTFGSSLAPMNFEEWNIF